MNRHEAIKKLKYYQRWRMGDDDDLPMPDPKEISKAINFAIEKLESNHEMISEIENAMERWHLSRDNDNETLEAINQSMLVRGYLEWHNKKK